MYFMSYNSNESAPLSMRRAITALDVNEAMSPARMSMRSRAYVLSIRDIVIVGLEGRGRFC